MERPSRVPPLVRPADCGQDPDALIMAGQPSRAAGRPSPFAGLIWRLFPDGSQRDKLPRRPHAGA